MREAVAAALEISPEEADALMAKLDAAMLKVEVKKPTDGRGLYSFLDPGKIEFADGLVVQGGPSSALQARCEAAAKIALNPVTWFAKPATRMSMAGPIAGFVRVVPTGSDVDPLAVSEDEVGSAGTGKGIAYLKISAQSHPYYWIAGWAWDLELAEAPGHCIDIADLRSIPELKAEVQRRSQDAVA
jgi:hypothetical protein